MIAAVAFSTPGKTILLGEHAAVFGYPAIVAAVGSRMTVAVRAAPGPTVRLRMPTFAFRGERPWDEILPLAETEPDEPVRKAGELAWFALAEAAREAPRPLAGLDVTVESAIPPGAGFGSSAALAVAVVAAVRRALGGAGDRESIAGAALAVERRQHGRPSGVDVEAVLRGGVLWCAREAGALACDALAPSPSVLGSIRLYHSGSPRETTGEMVAEVRRSAERDEPRIRRALDAIGEATIAGRSALENGDPAALAPPVRRAEAALEALGVVPAGVREAIRAIEFSGGAAKVSGAGGLTGAGAGLVLVVHPDPSWHDRFRVPAGWTAHAAALGAAGLRAESPA